MPAIAARIDPGRQLFAGRFSVFFNARSMGFASKRFGCDMGRGAARSGPASF
jgi:hypothetical protein